MKALAATILCMSMATSMIVMIPGTTHAAPADGWIEGTVRDGVDPIPDVMLIYLLNMMGGGRPLGYGLSDGLGHYNLTVTGGLTYMVLAFEGNHYSSSAVAIVNSGETTAADIEMTSIAPAVTDVTLHGFVTDELGYPVTEGTILGYTNDPLMTEGGPPYYGNYTTPLALGEFYVDVIPGALGGGVGIMGVTGYDFAENSSSDPFVSGMTYWLNISLAATVSTDDAVIQGTVTDSLDNQLENVLVSIESRNQWNEDGGYSNFTYTDALGHYEMNVTNGTSNIMFSKMGYSLYRMEGIQIDPGDTVTIDAQLVGTVATIRGNVTNSSDGSPIANAQVYLTDMMSNFTMAFTNSSGEYVLDAFQGTELALVAEADGYGRVYIMVNVSLGDALWYDFELLPADAWMLGRITDAITDAPIEQASVYIYNEYYDEWTETNATGDYYLKELVSGTYSISINAADYRHVSDVVDILPGENVHDVQMTPWDIPDSCYLWGYVYDADSMTAIAGARVETGTGPPDYSENNATTTDITGYYRMWIPAIPLVYVASALNHTHDEGPIDASGMTDIRLDIFLGVDLWSPNMSYSQSPLENVSWTKPTFYTISVEEIDPSMFALTQFLYYDSEMGVDNYVLVAMYYDNLDPLNYPVDDLPYSWLGDDDYSIGFVWDGTAATGGWLRNGADEQYLGWYMMWMGPYQYYALQANYTNLSLGMWITGTAFFDVDTGDFAFFQTMGPLPPADASDLTGMISPLVNMMQVEQIGGSMNWTPNVEMGEWSVVDLTFQPDDLVPSGRWLSVFSVSDFSNHGNGTVEFFTVDNDPPVADAGSDQWAVENTAVILNGSLSHDNVGIVDFAWEFWDDGTYYEIHDVVVTHNFTEVGDHDVTLTVTDDADHMSSMSIWVNVTADMPPVAYAGADWDMEPGSTYLFDGSGSTDDVMVVSWTWNFTYDGGEEVLYGANPSFDFLIEGIYVVTLTVNDTSGQTSTDTVQLRVVAGIPEFPTMLIPISGMLLLMAVAGVVRRRRQ